MVSPLRVPALPAAWRFALVGALASLPLTALLNRLPDSEATIGGGIMIAGAFVAGVVAALRSADPGAAGLRTGFIGAVLGLLVFVVTAGAAATWSLPRALFWIVASLFVVCLAPLFGLGFGHFGGWVATTVASRWTASTDAP